MVNMVLKQYQRKRLNYFMVLIEDFRFSGKSFCGHKSSKLCSYFHHDSAFLVVVVVSLPFLFLGIDTRHDMVKAHTVNLTKLVLEKSGSPFRISQKYKLQNVSRTAIKETAIVGTTCSISYSPSTSYFYCTDLC